MVGIVGYGSYIPRYRIKIEDIAGEWGKNAELIKKGILVYEKTVPGLDEDTVTIAVQAARNALKRAGIEPVRIGSVYVGSESHPYAVKPSSSIVAEALSITPEVHIADFEFACKAGTEAMWVAYNEVKSGELEYALAIGADTSQGAPGDALEFTAAAGGTAYIFGKDKLIAEVVGTYSYSTDTPDFWRREGAYYPKHGGRFTGEPAYFKHIYNAGQGILKKTNMKPEDFAYAVFHMPNGKFPRTIGKRLGFNTEQMRPGWIVPDVGNFYSGASPTGLSAAFDVAKPGDLILIISFGSGAGSDAFVFKITDRIEEVRDLAPKVRDMIDTNKIYLDYGKYVKFRKKIIMNE